MRHLSRHGGEERAVVRRQRARREDVPDLPQTVRGTERVRNVPQLSSRCRGEALPVTGTTGRLVSLGRLMRMDVRLDHAVSLGESPDNDICLVGDGIASHHARVVPVNGHWWVEPVDDGAAAASCINGRPLLQPTVLSHLDVVTLGRDVELVFLSSPAAAAVTPAGPAHTVKAAAPPKLAPPPAAA